MLQTRQLALLNEHRRQLVDDRTALTNHLTTLLKGYFPEALRWAGDLRKPLAWDFLAQFPSLERAQQASRLDVLKLYRAHTRRSPEQIEELCEEIRSAPSAHHRPRHHRELGTDDGDPGGTVARAGGRHRTRGEAHARLVCRPP